MFASCQSMTASSATVDLPRAVTVTSSRERFFYCQRALAAQSQDLRHSLWDDILYNQATSSLVSKSVRAAPPLAIGPALSLLSKAGVLVHFSEITLAYSL
jgi:hypothetical protein